MDIIAGAHAWDGAERPGDVTSQMGWQDTVHLLRLVQDDYAGARQELKRVSQTLADREALVNERLQYALLESTGHRTMCLVPYRVGALGSSLGKATLGAVARMAIPSGKPRLEVRCLGRFELSWNGNTIPECLSAVVLPAPGGPMIMYQGKR